MASKLQLFDLHGQTFSGKPKRVAIDPRRVSHIRQTVHGSVFIAYTKDMGFDVTGDIETVTERVNQGRGE